MLTCSCSHLSAFLFYCFIVLHFCDTLKAERRENIQRFCWEIQGTMASQPDDFVALHILKQTFKKCNNENICYLIEINYAINIF